MVFAIFPNLNTSYKKKTFWDTALTGKRIILDYPALNLFAKLSANIL